MGYLHIDNLYKNNTILLFKRCYALEKLHGCLTRQAKIYMADGTKKSIEDISVGDFVFGIIDGKLQPTKVTEKFNNGRTSDWVNVVTTRNLAGRGPAKASLMCTHEHKFYNPDTQQFVCAKDIKTGDSVLLIRSETEGSYLQKQVLLGKQNVIEIKENKTNSPRTKFDLETECHNYIANGIVVHNSSAHVLYKDGQVIYFSGGEKYTNFITLFNNDELTEKFKQTPFEKVVVYGEAYGGKQQGQSWRYGKELKFCAFDVRIDDNWLNVPSAERFVKNLGLEFVYYEECSTELEELDKQRDAPSEQAKRNSMGDDKPREGVVLRPLIELRVSEEKRVIVKHKRAEERETKTERKPLPPEEQKVLDDAKAIAEEYVTKTRLEHVLDKLKKNGEEVIFERVVEVIYAMTEDVLREGVGEFADSKDVRRAIGNKAVSLFKKRLSLMSAGRMDLWGGTVTK